MTNARLNFIAIITSHTESLNPILLFSAAAAKLCTEEDEEEFNICVSVSLCLCLSGAFVSYKGAAEMGGFMRDGHQLIIGWFPSPSVFQWVRSSQAVTARSQSNDDDDNDDSFLNS